MKFRYVVIIIIWYAHFAFYLCYSLFLLFEKNFMPATTINGDSLDTADSKDNFSGGPTKGSSTNPSRLKYRTFSAKEGREL